MTKYTKTAIALQILILPVLAWFVWGADKWMAVSHSYPSYLIIALMTGGFLLLPGAIARNRRGLVLPGAWFAFLVALPFVNNSSLKPLMWGVHALEPGMSRVAVMQTLKEHYAGTQYPEPVVHSEEDGERWGWPGTTRLLLKPQGRHPGYSAESLLVFFEEGSFTRATFSED